VHKALSRCYLAASTPLIEAVAILCMSIMNLRTGEQRVLRRRRAWSVLYWVQKFIMLGALSGIPATCARTDVDLATWTKPGQGLDVWGTAAGDYTGHNVADAGDVNHDGYQDILIGAYAAGPGRAEAGAAYLIFGSPSRSTSTVDTASALPLKGIKISGATAGDQWGVSVSGAGDVNKDGIDDFIIGAQGFDPPSRSDAAGAAVVIFGKTSGWADINLASFTSGSAGFWILGAAALDRLGCVVSGAGDVNGDGAGDIIVGAYLAGPLSRPTSGAAYVIFGHSSTTAFGTIDLASSPLGSSGFSLFGAVNADSTGYAVSGAGDLNGDGFDEIIVGAIGYDGPGGANCGAVYVIFGHSAATAFTDIDLATLSSSQGFRITGAVTSGHLGYSLSGAGDFNHDGYDDIVVGSAADRAYVLFGHSSSTGFPHVDLTTFTAGISGFVVSGNGFLGRSVGGGVDINKDGVDDIAITASAASPDGAVYVLYGRSQPQWANINVLTGLPSVSGYRILGAAAASTGSWSVSLVRDFDGDSVGDLVMGAPYADPSNRADAGAAYLIYGELSTPTSQPSRQPTSQPSRLPTLQPSGQPSRHPTSQPSLQPSRQPTSQPSKQPTSQPSRQPSARPTSSPVSERSGDVDLSTWTKPGKGLEVWGTLAGDRLGYSVADAGDVNKDGYHDILVGAYTADVSGKIDAGAVYLVFGSPSRTASTIDTATALSPKGIKVSGKAANDNWGRSVSCAGDFNDDGIDDLIVGGYLYDPPSRTDAGAAVVIFGKTSGWADIDLTSFTSGSAGFWMYGVAAADYFGIAVSGAGDMNGDGADDVVVGANKADPPSGSSAGASYVIFGHSAATAFNTIDLSTFSWGTAGFRIFGAAADDDSGESLCSAGDVNGDGYSDVLIRAWAYDGPNGADSGAVYVIFGHSTASVFTDINLATIPSSQGFRITGAAAGNSLGSLSSAGDFNRDGYDDIVVGSWAANKAYVLFGHSNAAAFPNVDVGALAASTAGFVVSGSGNLGYKVGGGIDVNGDGVDDVVITAPTYSPGGVAYVLYGRPWTHSDINLVVGLSRVSGFCIIGSQSSTSGDWYVSLVLDFDGDGVGDVLVGMPNGDPASRTNAGVAYLVYGELSAPTSQPSRQPTVQPSRKPSLQPSSQPTAQPSRIPTTQPSGTPSRQPTSQPSVRPSQQPTGQPSRLPTSQPSQAPTGQPTSQPSRKPSSQPSAQPSRRPTSQPSVQPSRQPTSRPSRQPTGRPSRRPRIKRVGDVNLATWSKPGQGLEVWGSLASDHMGHRVADAGDVNKDGYHDVLIGSYTADVSGETDAGAAYLVFGSPSRSTSTIDTANVASPNVIKISGIAANDYWGMALSGAGDFNKDGIDDLIISSIGFDPPTRTDAGAAVVIFGKNSGWADINLASFTSGSAGFWILGDKNNDQLRAMSSAAGDVNGDGADDVIVGAQYADPQDRTNAGISYVIFGYSATSFNTVDLSTFVSGSAGFKVYGATAEDSTGALLSGAGDINGDGYGEVIIGATGYDGPGGTDCGAAYVILGHSPATAFTDIDLAALSISQGFRITGAAANNQVGYSLSRAGDFNHDGYDDLVLGSQANKAYIVFGHSNATAFPNMNLATFSTGTVAGFEVSGSGSFGYSVSGGTDINGDETDDLVVTAPSAASNGAAYVLYGRSLLVFANINVLAAIPSVIGFRILGTAAAMTGGWSVGLVRDFDGDGVSDIILGARNGDPSGRTDAGTAYLVYGELSAPTSQPSRQPTGQPSRLPTAQPSRAPTGQPTSQPSRQPTSQPSVLPSRQPSGQPSRTPTGQPSIQPFGQPTSQPSRQPSARPTSSPVSERSGDVNLATWTTPGHGLELWGGMAGDNAGSSIAAAGDVNKDGYQDILVGAYLADLPGKPNVGAAYLVFGSSGRSTRTIDTANAVIPTVIRILGAVAGDSWGRSVSGAGDVNMDGIDDIIVGGPSFDPPSRYNGGAAVVIFGKTSGWADIDLASFTSGSAGFWIYGLAVETYCGFAISAAGDFNGDGAGDLIVGCGWASALGKSQGGTSYVVFGHGAATSYAPIDLASFNAGSAGFRIFGATSADYSGYSVSGAGDVNGDGYGDVTVGALYYDGPGGTDSGAAYVIFGHSTATAFTDIDLAALSGNQGFRVTGAAANHNLGSAVSSAGDFNHDGYDDVVVGSQSDKAYVLFGHSTATAFTNVNLALSTAGFSGFVVSGSGGLGSSISGGADINRDGVDDIVISAPTYSSTGVAYVLYGRAQTQFADVSVLAGLSGVSGFKILGTLSAASGDWKVDLVGDFDGDGVGDILVGAPYGDPSGRTDAGTAYLIYGELSAPTSQPSRQPSGQPSWQPTTQPSSLPTAQPSRMPTAQPSVQPSRQPTSQPSRRPTRQPTSQPSRQPTSQPSQTPTGRPTSQPSRRPTRQPTSQPSRQPTSQPSRQPSRQPSTQPSRQPTRQPTSQPTKQPSTQPTGHRLQRERAGDVNLATWTKPGQGLEVWGSTLDGRLGSSVATAGDINRDGYQDILIGAYIADVLGRTDAGTAYVVFGSPRRVTSIIDTAIAVAPSGIQIFGAFPGDYWGASVNRAGDFNKDGIDDFTSRTALELVTPLASDKICALASRCKPAPCPTTSTTYTVRLHIFFSGPATYTDRPYNTSTNSPPGYAAPRTSTPTTLSA
jgi:hypothetical protein